MRQSKFAVEATSKTDEQILDGLNYPNNCYDRDVANQNEAILRIWKKVFGDAVVDVKEVEVPRRGRKAKAETEEVTE